MTMRSANLFSDELAVRMSFIKSLLEQLIDITCILLNHILSKLH